MAYNLRDKSKRHSRKNIRQYHAGYVETQTSGTGDTTDIMWLPNNRDYFKVKQNNKTKYMRKKTCTEITGD